MRKALIALTALALLAGACQQNSKSSDNTSDSTGESKVAKLDVPVPVFQADSAFAYTAKQVSFGPRIPNTPAQEKCADWLINNFRPWADTLYVQRTTVIGPKKEKLPCINIIASFNPAAKQRVLLLAHWDTRPWADEDAFDKTKKLDGADDGASGVAVLMEVARQFHAQKPEAGVDILLVDVEDYGAKNNENSFCLGTQYWAKNPHVKGYKANYGILLDMVGARGSQFYMEGASQQYAAGPMKMFWDVANKQGFSDYFRYENYGSTITDDHIYVNTMANIPTFDIIAWQANGNFAPHWHTQNDNMDVIDKKTLKAVGQTILQVVYTQPFNY
ncbi:Zn-dependent M28 family amino/carboxypeptidase [Chitinophaga niastensis]|uniref:Zn-dependent M28 family amino/carboxypeptidase n=1 Tax=Chitinophaga niastensis TaxID=536980 RepID=A0A2P8HSL7_CHINA|nr:M28 family peptidase [Chitinophaga niastensis]PSL49192.1 Zn-dependent M28 family amino/carboxypeptidase [Chitinophaga niastensis]